MSQPASAAAETTAADVEMDDKAMMAEIRQKLAKYDQLEQEISKLTQEQATLESYVTNLMSSNVRASKPVNYFEQTFDASDESDFAQSSPSQAAPTMAKRGTRKAKDDSESDEEFDQDSDSESDYEGKGDKKGTGRCKKTAETSKPKQTAVAAKSTASRAKKTGAPAAKKTATATAAPAKKSTPAIVRPTLKKSTSSQLGSLLKSPSRPTSPKAVRPSLASGGSSGSLSLQVSPVSARKIGMRGGSGVSSLKSLLGGSSVPRAGLSRRVLPKK
ncbi:hypothetical protein IWW37_001207 [Coemansia sp. RSA 2050]|nr:hypothetical protein IWW37_001207 [Coemansia sp. RSA 2050]